MQFVLPATPALHPTLHLAPQSYEYPNQGYYRLHPNVPRFAVPLYPPFQQRSFRQPSAEELEEREYQRALVVIFNNRLRQVEKEAAIHQWQRAEAVRQQYLASLAAELEQQQRQEESLASHRARIIRMQQARARLAAGERQLVVNEFLCQLKGAQLVCCVCMLPVGSVLTIPQKFPYRSHVAKYRPLPDLDSRLSYSDESKEDSAKRVESHFSSPFPGLIFHAQPVTPTPTTQPKTDDDGESKAQAVDPGETKGSAQKLKSADVTATFESSYSSSIEETTSSAKPTTTETERIRADTAAALSSVEQIRNNLTKLQTDFILPTELDHYVPSIGDQDEAASVSSASSSDLTKLIPYTSTNKPVYKYEHELNGLLEELDGIESHGDPKVRDERKEVVKAIEEALEEVERVVGEAIEKRLSLVARSAPVTEEPLKEFDVGDGVVEEIVPTSTMEQVDTDYVKDAVKSTPALSEAAVTIFVEEFTSVGKTLPESNAPAVSDDATTAHHINPSLTEPEPTESRTPAKEVDSGADGEVIVLEDEEKNDY